MNIFYLHNDPKKCAELHADKHVVKMILEYAQLLSTAHRVLDGTICDTFTNSGRRKKAYIIADSRNDFLYSSTHINHPSAIWVRHSYENYEWLYKLFIAVLNEYTYRYGKIHATARLIDVLYTPPIHIPKGVGFTEPTPAMPDEYKVSGNSVRSYINYYLGAKQHLASWKKRQTPEWFTYA
jgi:hypothetical protein